MTFVAPTPRRKCIGVIGAIGAGKSRVAAHLRDLSAVVVDGDAVGHEVLADPAIASRIVEAFGERVASADGRIDRRALGRIVFSKPAAKELLESIVHPPMRRVFEEKIAAGRADPAASLVVFDAAILLEAGWDDLVDEIVFVDADRAVREARVAARGWSPLDLSRRESAQLPLDRKRERANHIVVNNGDWEACRKQVDELFGSWTAASLAAEKAPIDL
jgi:dephospho-CoA kinase